MIIHEHGKQAEDLALEYLKTQGLNLLHQRFACKLGEIDLIMHDPKFLIFVEVRYRKKNLFGSAADSVTVAKQQKIRRTAEFFLQKNKKYQKFPCRFDLVTIDSELDLKNINWFVNAF